MLVNLVAHGSEIPDIASGIVWPGAMARTTRPLAVQTPGVLEVTDFVPLLSVLTVALKSPPAL